jgi:hypothetical protein
VTRRLKKVAKTADKPKIYTKAQFESTNHLIQNTFGTLKTHNTYTFLTMFATAYFGENVKKNV